ncbi:MAG: response regulator [Planctomycetes bacterium]|nr:response regulator [Planctomycetota bacterium]
MKVVVAEIDPSLRTDFQRKFDTWGHEAVVVEDGLEAWKAIKQHKPDMVILNWELPTLDGLDLCEKIRESEELPYVYIIMLTEKSHDDYRVAGFTMGVDDFLVKPVDDVLVQSRIVVGTRIAAYEGALTRQNEELRRQCEQMEALAATRDHQRVLAERVARAAILSADACHGIDEPTAFVADNIKVLEASLSEIETLLTSHILAGPERKRLARIHREMAATTEQIRNGLEPFSNMMFRLMAHRFEQKSRATAETAAG